MWRTTPLLVTLALISSPARADEDDAPTQIAISVGTTLDEDRRIRTLLYGIGIDAGTLEIAHGATRILGEGELGLFGADTTDTCEGQPLSAAEYETLLQHAEEQFPLAEYEQAHDELTDLLERLPCLIEPVATDRLHRLYLLEGVAGWFTRGRQAAIESFTRAVSVEPDYRWEGEFGPSAQEAHVEAAMTVLNGERVTVLAAWSDDETDVYIDGRTLSLVDGKAEMSMPAGQHLIQVFRPGREVFTAMVELTGRVVLADRQALLDGLHELALGRTGGVGTPVLAALCHWMDAEGYRLGWIVLSREAVRRLRDEMGQGTTQNRPRRVTQIDPQTGEIGRPNPLPTRIAPYPWHGVVGQNGGLLVYRREGTVFTYASLTTTAMFPALPSMSAGFSAGVAARWDADTRQTTFLVPLQCHVRFGPDYGPLRPHVDIAGSALWLGEHEGPQFAAGVEGAVGLDVRPARDRIFGFGGGVRVGYVGGLTVNLYLGVSVQW